MYFWQTYYNTKIILYVIFFEKVVKWCHSRKLKPERLIFDASEKMEDYRKYQRVEFVRYSYEGEEPETDFRDRKIESSYAAAAGQRGK